MIGREDAAFNGFRNKQALQDEREEEEEEDESTSTKEEKRFFSLSLSSFQLFFSLLLNEHAFSL